MPINPIESSWSSPHFSPFSLFNYHLAHRATVWLHPPPASFAISLRPSQNALWCNNSTQWNGLRDIFTLYPRDDGPRTSIVSKSHFIFYQHCTSKLEFPYSELFWIRKSRIPAVHAIVLRVWIAVLVCKRVTTYPHRPHNSAWRKPATEPVQPVRCAYALRPDHVIPAVGCPGWASVRNSIIQDAQTSGPPCGDPISKSRPRACGALDKFNSAKRRGCFGKELWRRTEVKCPWSVLIVLLEWLERIRHRNE